MNKEAVLKALAAMKEKSKKRKFTQSVDLVINTKGIDFKSPEKRIGLEVALPKGRGKELKLALFAKKALAEDAKGKVDRIIKEEELAKLSKKDAKKLATEYDFFFAEPALMATIGKTLGTVLGPRRKMPKPTPNVKVLEGLTKAVKRMAVINNKGKGGTALHTTVGTEAMSDEELSENIIAVINALEGKLDGGLNNIRSLYVKMTMGPASPIEVKA